MVSFNVLACIHALHDLGAVGERRVQGGLESWRYDWLPDPESVRGAMTWQVDLAESHSLSLRCYNRSIHTTLVVRKWCAPSTCKHLVLGVKTSSAFVNAAHLKCMQVKAATCFAVSSLLHTRIWVCMLYM